MQFEIAACTDVGTRKKVNQDSLHVCVAQTKLGEVIMAVICDGVGGLSYGEIASSKTVYEFKKWFQYGLPDLIEKEITISELEQEWRTLIAYINRKIVKISEAQSSQMGTTLTAVIFLQGQYLVVQIGDSRFYEIYDGQLIQITTDQTLVEREVQLGHITREQGMSDPRRHVLLQCIGLNEIVEPQFLIGKQNGTANYLLCTDGFYNSLMLQEIYDLCWIKGNKEELQMQLLNGMEICKTRGEQDNISAILLGT